MRISKFFSILFFLLSSLIADDQINESTPIGIKVQVNDQVILGPELEAKPLTQNSSVVLRIKAIRPHGDAYRYDYEYYGLVSGSFDLGDYLQAKNGEPFTNKPKLPVQFKSSLPPEQIRPNPLEDQELPYLIKYKHKLIIIGILWVLGLLLLIFIRRKQFGVTEYTSQESLSTAEILRPLVHAAKQGNLGKSDQAKLERTLILFWSERLNIRNESSKEVISKIRSHSQAKLLFDQLELWFHCPNPEEPSDLDSLLEPYSKPENN